jgi:Domain of unknown function (DUF4258)
MTRVLALERVRAAAEDSANLRWTAHIRQRMEERGIDDSDVLRIVRTGDVAGDPVEGKTKGEWKIKLTRKLSNGRVAGVVTALLVNGQLRLLTTEWEDHR